MKFSLGKFNVKSSESFDIEIRLIFSDSIKNILMTSKAISFILDMRTKLSGSADLTIGTPFNMDLIDELKNINNMVVNVPSEYSYVNELGNKSVISKNMTMENLYMDNLLSSGYLSKDMEVVIGEFISRLDINTILSKNMYINDIMSELLGSNISTASLINDILKLNLTLKPGESIEINSGNFTIFKDDENILHLHKGDWIKAHRETVSINIESGTGRDLEGNISYVERYL